MTAGSKSFPPATVVPMPKLGANDDTARIVNWLVKAGDSVAVGQDICEVETAKAVSEVVSSAAGYVKPLADIGATLAVHAPLAVVSDTLEFDETSLLAEYSAQHRSDDSSAQQEVSGPQTATRKAQLLARRYGLDVSEVSAQDLDGVIREQDVERTRNRKKELAQKQSSQNGVTGVERVLIIGSVHGGGAAIVVDILLRSKTQLPVTILDSDSSTHGVSVLGVPVTGASDLETIKSLYESGSFDAAIIAFNRNLLDRETLFDALVQGGIPLANAIDGSAEIRSGVRIGRGNVIAALSYVGPQACIGDNNFLSSRTTIEHHCVIGSHCGFGPAVTFSGQVRVGNRVRFGTQIAAEPNIEIGDRAVIASTSVLTTDVPSDAIVKALVAHRTLPASE